MTSELPEDAIELATRLYNGARSGDIALVEQALKNGLPANMRNEKGDTLLMLAAYHGHASLVLVLIQYGADPNILNDRNQSPLAGAVFKNEDAVVETLLEHGADPNIGSPSAMEAISLFGQEHKWKDRFSNFNN